MMYSIYTVKSGDTLEKISRRIYGYPEKSKDISVLNGVSDPLTEGTQLKYTTEDDKSFGKGQSLKTTADINAVKILINGELLPFTGGYNYSENLLSVRSLNFIYPYDNNNYKIKSLFKYGSDIKLYENEELIFTGMIKNIPKIRSGNERSIFISAKSRAGILIDSDFPLSSYPLEYNDLTLRQIVEKVAGIKGILVSFQEGNELILDSKYGNDFGNGVSAKVNESMMSFIIRLTKGKGLIISDNEYGNLYVYKAKDKKSIGELILGKTKGFQEIIEHRNFDSLAENYIVFSQYDSNNAIGNVRIEGFPLPITKSIIVENNISDDIENLATWFCCREIGNAIKYNMTLTISKLNEKTIKTGDYIDIKAEDLDIEKTVIIESISRSTGKKQIINLTATILNSYNGIIPRWEDI